MDEIIKLISDIDYKENVSFKTLTSFKTGGNAALVVYPKNIDEIKKVLKICKKKRIKYAVFGNGTNILASDKDYDGIIIKLDKFELYDQKVNSIHVSAGHSLSSLCINLCKNNYKGFAFGVGIPGTVGGAVYMNAGAYGEEVKDILEYVIIMYKGLILKIKNKKLKFTKRYSKLQELRDVVILSACFKLEESQEDLMEKVKENTEKRKNSQPLEYPNAGSVFSNPQTIPAGKLIEELGLKGYTVGGASVSHKHANFIVNDGDATSLDILNIIEYIQMKALNERNIKLTLEIRLFNF